MPFSKRRFSLFLQIWDPKLPPNQTKIYTKWYRKRLHCQTCFSDVFWHDFCNFFLRFLAHVHFSRMRWRTAIYEEFCVSELSCGHRRWFFWLYFLIVFLARFFVQFCKQKIGKSHPGVGPSKKRLRRPLLVSLEWFPAPQEGLWRVPGRSLGEHFSLKRGGTHWSFLLFARSCSLLGLSGNF